MPHRWESDRVWERMDRQSSRVWQVAEGVTAWEHGFGLVWAGSWQRSSHLESTPRGRRGVPCLVSFLGSQGEGEKEVHPEGKHVLDPHNLNY